MTDSSIILPGDEQPGVDSMIAHLPDTVWLRNPKTGVIFKFDKKRDVDVIRHALKGETGESGRLPYSLSTEEAAKAQAIELAKLQGRPLPAWAVEETPAAPAGAAATPQPAGAASTAKAK